MNIIRERGRGRACDDIEIRPRGDVGAPWGAPHRFGTQTGQPQSTSRLGVSATCPRKRALSRTCPRGHGRVPFGSGRVPGCPRTGTGTTSECLWGWDGCPRPHSVHSTHVRSTVRVGKGEHWTRTGLVSGVHPGTLERHTPTAAEYSPVHWCAFRVRVRCLEQAAVGFLDWFCSNASNRHIYITSQHLQLNSRPPRLSATGPGGPHRPKRPMRPLV